MKSNVFYLDTCIWLNLFKKEIQISRGKAYWKIAKEFIEKVIFSEKELIAYSGLVLRELKFKLEDEYFFEKATFLKQESRFIFVDVEKKDYQFARKLESESNFELSFYDCLHISICKRLDMVLVTRDRKLITFAGNYISAHVPEELMI